MTDSGVDLLVSETEIDLDIVVSDTESDFGLAEAEDGTDLGLVVPVYDSRERDVRNVHTGYTHDASCCPTLVERQETVPYIQSINYNVCLWRGFTVYPVQEQTPTQSFNILDKNLHSGIPWDLRTMNCARINPSFVPCLSTEVTLRTKLL